MKRRVFLILMIILSLTACSNREKIEDGGFFVASEDVAIDGSFQPSAFVPVLEGPVRPLSATPFGSMSALNPGQGIAISFSRPMVPLGDAPAPPAGQLQIEPDVAGTLKWSGTQTLLFQPNSSLPLATEFKVTLLSGLASVEGDRITEDFTWTFNTPRPQVLLSTPNDGASDVDLRPAIDLMFNQPVVASRLRDFIELVPEGTGGLVSYSIDNRGDSTVVVRPGRELRRGTSYSLVLKEGLPGKEGPLGQAAEQKIQFTTYRELEFLGFSEGGYYDEASKVVSIDPAGGLTFHFTTPVRFGDLRKVLTFTPAIEWPLGIEARDAAVGSSHRISMQWEPETAYSVRIGSLKDVFDQRLSSATGQFKTLAFQPMVEMKSGVMVIEAGEMAAIPVRAVNAPTVQIGRKRLSPDEIIPVIQAYDDWRWYGEEDTESIKPIEATESFNVDLPRNRISYVPLALDPALRDGKGVVAVRLKATLGSREYDKRDTRALAQVTNLGITAKFSPHQNLILVTRLDDATPVSGAKVAIRDQDNNVRWEGTTGRDGKVETPGWSALNISQRNEWSQPIQFAFVEKDGDFAFTNSLFNDGIEPYRFALDFAWDAEAEVYSGTVFSDRGLYRAGETVHIKGVFRKRTDDDWKVIPDSLRAIVENPRGEVVFDRRFRTGEFGTLDFDWISSANADQGQYGITITSGIPNSNEEGEESSENYIAYGSFRVDSFRRASFSVSARAQSTSFIAGDFFEGAIEGRYLFGAPMSNQPVSYSLERQDASFTPPGYEDFLFGVSSFRYYSDDYDDSAEDLWTVLASNEGTQLDEDGLVNIRVQTPGNSLGTPTKLVLEGLVTDPARQESAGRRTFMLHPGMFYVGLKPQTTFVQLNRTKNLAIDVLTVDPNGFPLSGEVQLELIRQEWNSVREAGMDGRVRWRTERTEVNKGNSRVVTREGNYKRMHLEVPEAGSYVVRATGRDVRGNIVRTEAYFYATGRDYVAWQRNDDDKIDLVADKRFYSPGETARILVQSPYEEATALITVERDGIISSEVKTLEGSAPQIDIRLGENHLPNAFVSVILLSGRTAPPRAGQDIGAPGFKVGYLNLRVDPGVRKLDVEIETDADTFRPGEEITVQLRLKDSNGRGVPGEIAFSAADAGVLNLIGYQLPDPFDAFYGPRELRVTTTENRSILLLQRSYGEKEEDVGGGGGDSNDNVRKDFRAQAHWAPALRTDGSGRVSVTFRLPESLTTFRLMAAGITQNHRFGMGKKDIVVTKPLVLLPALPRFSRLDDVFEAGVLVNNSTGKDGQVTVKAQATGITLTGDKEKTVNIKHGETREVRFAWKGSKIGEAEITFSASLGGERDQFLTTLPVVAPASKSTYATFASTDGTARELVRLNNDIVPGLGSLFARVSSTALVGLDGAADYLFRYPYGCLEQQTSRIRPLFAGKEILDAFDVTVLDGKEDMVIEEWTSNLSDYWTGDGFSLWPGGRYVSPYVTAYAVAAMAEAKNAGYEVPESIQVEAVKSLRSMVLDSNKRPAYQPESTWETTRAFMLFALAQHGEILESELFSLATKVSNEQVQISVDGLSHLLRAIVTADRESLRGVKNSLAQRVKNMVQVTGTESYLEAPQSTDYWWIFASTNRSTALGLSALIEADGGDSFRPVAEGMVRYLMNQRANGRWASTQENMAIVEALAGFYRAYERTVPNLRAEVKVAGQALLAESFEGRTLKVAEGAVPIEKLSAGQDNPVVISVSGSGRAYYSLRLETFSRSPQPAANNGLAVTRSIQRMNNQGVAVGAPMDPSSGTIQLAPGEMVKVTLRVVSPADRNYVVVDDPLPAGLEALNSAFETTSAAAAANSGQNRWWGSFNHTEIRDDRVLLFADYLRRGEHVYSYVARATSFGTFQYPSVYAEMMYRAEVFGRNAHGKLIVRE